MVLAMSTANWDNRNIVIAASSLPSTTRTELTEAARLRCNRCRCAKRFRADNDACIRRGDGHIAGCGNKAFAFDAFSSKYQKETLLLSLSRMQLGTIGSRCGRFVQCQKSRR